MKQTVKVIIVVLLIFTCVSYYHEFKDILSLPFHFNHNSEDASSLKVAYSINQVNALQGNYVPQATDVIHGTGLLSIVTEGSKQLKEMPKITLNQAHNPPDPFITTDGSSDKPPSPITDKESKGYILPYSIYEQQTNGANNLWQLQLWAKQVGMKVVEPFAKNSFFTMRTIIPNFSQALRFGDYFDKEEWNEMVMKAGGNPLVTWEEFITDFPRKAIILHTIKRDNYRPLLTIAYDENTTVCEEYRISHYNMIWINETFNILKKMCYLCDAKLRHTLSLEKFNSLIFSDNGIKLNEVTLIVVNWLGIRPARIDLNPDKMFTIPLKSFPPSQRIMTAYKTYRQKHIKGHKYVGVIFRTYHVLYVSNVRGNFTDQSKYLLQCSKRLGDVLDKVRKKWKIFLAYDMGMFGSRLNLINKKKLVSLQKQIFVDVFNGSLQIKEREKYLRNVINGTRDRGLIALLEKVIATNAHCIILLGPHSAFVRSSSYLYMSLHPSERCIVSICAEKVKDNNNKVISSDTIPEQFINDL